MLAVLALTIAAIAIIMFAMAIGVVMKRPCLRGSCGGPDVLTSDGDPISCETCPNRDKAHTAATG
jgi:hypothetical protein